MRPDKEKHHSQLIKQNQQKHKHIRQRLVAHMTNHIQTHNNGHGENQIWVVSIDRSERKWGLFRDADKPYYSIAVSWQRRVCREDFNFHNEASLRRWLGSNHATTRWSCPNHHTKETQRRREEGHIHPCNDRGHDTAQAVRQRRKRTSSEMPKMMERRPLATKTARVTWISSEAR
jgi:hypothetical protein